MISMKLYKIIFISSYVLSEIVVMASVSNWGNCSIARKIIYILLFFILNSVIIYIFRNSLNNINILQTLYINSESQEYLEVLNPKDVNIEFSGSEKDLVPFNETDIEFDNRFFNSEYSTDFIANALNKNIIKDVMIISVSTTKQCVFYIPKDTDTEITLLWLLTDNGMSKVNITENYIDITLLMNAILQSDTDDFAVILAHKRGDEQQIHQLYATKKIKIDEIISQAGCENNDTNI